jgi:hypothetical protein
MYLIDICDRIGENVTIVRLISDELETRFRLVGTLQKVTNNPTSTMTLLTVYFVATNYDTLDGV